MSKRRGRPPKSTEPRKRYSLGLIVTASMKQRIERLAFETGRTQSQAAEYLLERAFFVSDFIEAALAKKETLA
jgi:predicted DNA-binding protein